MKEDQESNEEKHARVTITLPPDILEGIDRLAVKQERSRSKLIARAMRFFLQATEGGGENPPSGGLERHRPNGG